MKKEEEYYNLVTKNYEHESTQYMKDDVIMHVTSTSAVTLSEMSLK